MTPEQTFNKQVWEILQDLKEEILATESGKPVKVRHHYNIVGAGIIPNDRRQNILFKLQEWGALKVRENPLEPPSSTTEWFYLDINQTTFDSIYTKFQKTCDLQSYLNEYQEQLLSDDKGTPPQFRQVKRNEDGIDQWLATRDNWALQKIWQVISALHSEWQLRNENTFDIPHDKFERARITNNNDLEAILTTLHKQEVIEVSRKIAQTPPSDRPQGSLWVTIVEKPDITTSPDTQVKVFPEKLSYLYATLPNRIKGTKADRSPKEKSKDEPHSVLWHFNSKTNTLVIKDVELRFKNDSLRSELLRIFSKNKANQTSEHHFTELFSEIDGSEPTDIKKAKRKMYDAVQGLVAQIATKTGQQSFLIYTSTTVRVSPQFSYKKP